MGTRMIPASSSIDDVMKLVGDGDNELVVLSEIADRVEDDSLTSVRDVNAHLDNLPPIDEEIADQVISRHTHDVAKKELPKRKHADVYDRFLSRKHRKEERDIPRTSAVHAGILKTVAVSSIIATPAEVSFRSPLASDQSPSSPSQKPHKASKVTVCESPRRMTKFGKSRDSSEETLSLIDNEKLPPH